MNASSIQVEGNDIGTDPTGTLNLGNTAGGVDIDYDSSYNVIGGLAAGAGNSIAFNGGNGVTVGSSDYYYYSTVSNGILSTRSTRTVDWESTSGRQWRHAEYIRRTPTAAPTTSRTSRW